MKLLKMLACVWVLFASAFAAHADVQIAYEHPKLSGAIGQAALPADSRVCPGSPVVLTVGLNPPLAISNGVVPIVSYQVIEGFGWFGTMEDMRTAPMGFFRLLFGRILARLGGQRTLVPLNAETGSTAIVFHPLGKDGDAVRIRAKGEGQAAELGSVDFIFKVGANHEYLLSRLAEQGLNNELRTEKLHYEVEEYADVKTATASGQWHGTPGHILRKFYDNKVVNTYLENPRKNVENQNRVPFDPKDSLYVKCRYWGETPTAIVGCLTDPAPPTPDATLTLYYFDKGSGLMTEFRFYGKSSCGWTGFLWNPDVGGGLPYNFQVQRRVWNPPTKLFETADIFRQNFKLLTEPEPTETPTTYDPNKEEETPAEQP
jgi:hypothetical protein